MLSIPSEYAKSNINSNGTADIMQAKMSSKKGSLTKEQQMHFVGIWKFILDNPTMFEDPNHPIALPLDEIQEMLTKKDKKPKAFKHTIVDKTGQRSAVVWNNEGQIFQERKSKRVVMPSPRDLPMKMNSCIPLSTIGMIGYLQNDDLLRTAISQEIDASHTGNHTPRQHTIKIHTSQFKSAY